MADKVVTFSLPNTPSQGHVSTSGSIAVDTIFVAFDDATEMSKVIEGLEIAKNDILDYYANRA